MASPNRIVFSDNVRPFIEIDNYGDSFTMSASTQSDSEVSGPTTPPVNDGRIDFDILEKLLAPKRVDDDGPQPYENIRVDAQYHMPSKVSRTPKSQRIILYSGSSESTYRASAFNALNVHEDLHAIFSDDEHHPWWLDVQNPSVQELRLLCSAFRIHPLTFEDIVTQESQEKIQDYTTYYFASVWSYHNVQVNDGNAYEPCTIYTVVFPSGTLSFSFSTTIHAMNVLERIELLKGVVAVKSDWVFYAFVDNIVDSFGPSIMEIDLEVSEIEEAVYTTREGDMQAFLLKIDGVRKRVSALTRLLTGKTKVLLSFEKHHCMDVSSDEDVRPGHNLKLYVNDVQDHIEGMLSNLHQSESLLSRSQSNYLAQASHETLQGRTRVNDLMALLTTVSMILTALNFVASMFGMNVNANIPLYQNSTPAWYIILGGEIFVFLVLMLLAKKFKWY